MLKKMMLVPVLVVVLGLSAMNMASASSHVLHANLTTGAEVHEVVGSNATGHAKFTVGSDGDIEFWLKASRLSGPSWGAHIHGPAPAGQNAGILVSLCGAPGPAAEAVCSTSRGVLRIEGVITSDLLEGWGLTAAELIGHLESGLAYVNVHTDLNRAGELRGQIR